MRVHVRCSQGLNRVADPDPHYLLKLDQDPRIREKSWIRIRINVIIKRNKIGPRTPTMEPWRVYRLVVAYFHHFQEELDSDPS